MSTDDNITDDESPCSLELVETDEGDTLLRMRVDGVGEIPILYVVAGAMNADPELLDDCIDLVVTHLARCGIVLRKDKDEP